MIRFIRFLIALGILILMAVLSSAYYEQFFVQGNPCPLCLVQRIGMIAVGTTALLNLVFGINLKFYVLTIVSAFIGGSVSVRQIFLNICPGNPLFGAPVLGLNLYTWCFLIFAASILGTILLIALYKPEHKGKLSMNWFEKLSASTLIFLTASNCITTYLECSFGPCQEGKAPPQVNFLDKE